MRWWGESQTATALFSTAPSHSTAPLTPHQVHRVQGATIEGREHVLLNAEFFAPGYVPVSMLAPPASAQGSA